MTEMDKIDYSNKERLELRQLKTRLEQLSEAVTSLSLILLSPSPQPEPQCTNPRLTLGKSFTPNDDDDDETPPTPTPKTRLSLSRFKSTFSSNKNKSKSKDKNRRFDVPVPIPSPTFRFGFGRKDDYDKLEDNRGLLDRRRGSADSDITLVNSPPRSPSRKFRDQDQQSGLTEKTRIDNHSPDHLLNLLAPLISSLQSSSRRLSTLVNSSNTTIAMEMETVKAFERVCQQLLKLLHVLTPRANVNSGNMDMDMDNHQLEMSVLMLDALTKKVQRELDTINSFVPAPISQTESKEIIVTPIKTQTQRHRQLSTSTSSSDTSTSTTLSISPLNLTKNPFIVHSTSIDVPKFTLTNPNRQRASISKSISSNTNMTTTEPNEGEYTTFISNSQNTSMMNIIRLGSFQASMLFSPSPIAVRRIANAPQRL